MIKKNKLVGLLIILSSLIVLILCMIFIYYVILESPQEPSQSKVTSKAIQENNQEKGELMISDNSPTLKKVEVDVPKNETIEDSKSSANDIILNPPENNKNYLIITRPLFVNNLMNNFVEWKEEQGFNVKIITVDEIEDIFEGEDIAEKIKDSVKYYYINEDVKYVLLVGDNEQKYAPYEDTPEEAIKIFQDSLDLDIEWNVPPGYYLHKTRPGAVTRGIKHENPVYGSDSSDLFYADLGDWDMNGDGFYERDEIKRDKKGLEIYLGRFPVRTNKELSRIITKTKNLPTFNEMLIVAQIARPCSSNNYLRGDGYLNCMPYYIFPSIKEDIPVTYMEDTEKLSEKEINARKEVIPSNFNFIQYDSNTKREKIIKEMISKNRIVIVQSHGGHNCISPRGSICKKDMNFDVIMPFFEFHACQTGTFFSFEEDNFAEHLIKSEKGPVLVGSPHNSKEFYEYIFNSATVGQAFYDTLWMEGGGYSTKFLFGDPSLVLYP